MIGRQRAIACGQRSATEVGELVGMQLHRQPGRRCGIEHPGDLFRRERHALAEGIDGVGQPFTRNRWKHLPHDRFDIGGLVAFRLGRQRMGSEEGRAHPHRTLPAQSSRDPERFPLARQVQPVAGLDLDCRHALGEQGVEPGQCLLQQVGFTRLAHMPYRRDDPATGVGDLLVGRTLETHLELASAIPGIDQMRVTVDQAGGDPAALAIGDGGIGRRQVGVLADPRDPPVAHGNRALLDHPQTWLAGNHRRDAGISPDMVERLWFW